MAFGSQRDALMSILGKSLLFASVSALHLVGTIASLSRTTYPNAPSEPWGMVLAILSFPLLSFGKATVFGIDILDWLVVGNSLLWGAAITFGLLRLLRKPGRRYPT